MASRRGSFQRDHRNGTARSARCAPLLLPVLLQVLGGLLALAAAGDVLEHDAAPPKPDASSANETAGSPREDRAPRGSQSQRGSQDEGPEDKDGVPPAGSSDAGGVPAGVKLTQNTSSESSRFAAGSRPAACGLGAPISGATRLRSQVASVPALAHGSPVGGSLSPLSPRGPPTA